jgi:2'-5' RNA ligase
MSQLLALDVALLLPPDVRGRAVKLSAALKPSESDRLTLDADHHPHITLTQQFIRVEELDRAFERVAGTLDGVSPLQIHVTGTAKTGHSVWMAIERTAPLAHLHERLMEALRGFERPGGGPAAFFDEDARGRDVMWVTGYPLKSSLAAFTPHVTLGQSDEPPQIESFTFSADTVAACHLGRFCTCRTVLRSWQLH